MTTLPKPYTGKQNGLEYLRDSKGIYGLKMLEPLDREKDDFYIVRPDRIEYVWHRAAAAWSRGIRIIPIGRAPSRWRT